MLPSDAAPDRRMPPRVAIHKIREIGLSHFVSGKQGRAVLFRSHAQPKQVKLARLSTFNFSYHFEIPFLPLDVR